MEFLTDSDDAMVFGWDSYADVVFEMRSSKTVLPHSNHSKKLYGELNNFWMDWRKHCFTWTNRGNFTVSSFVLTQNHLEVMLHVYCLQLFKASTHLRVINVCCSESYTSED